MLKKVNRAKESTFYLITIQENLTVFLVSEPDMWMTTLFSIPVDLTGVPGGMELIVVGWTCKARTNRESITEQTQRDRQSHTHIVFFLFIYLFILRSWITHKHTNNTWKPLFRLEPGIPALWRRCYSHDTCDQVHMYVSTENILLRILLPEFVRENLIVFWE